jgi:hypothetical protein
MLCGWQSLLALGILWFVAFASFGRRLHRDVSPSPVIQDGFSDLLAGVTFLERRLTNSPPLGPTLSESQHFLSTPTHQSTSSPLIGLKSVGGIFLSDPFRQMRQIAGTVVTLCFLGLCRVYSMAVPELP